jgi:hypothetical protein
MIPTVVSLSVPELTVPVNAVHDAMRKAPPRYAKTSAMVTAGPNSAATADCGESARIASASVGGSMAAAARNRSAVSPSRRPAASQASMWTLASLMTGVPRYVIRETATPHGRYSVPRGAPHGNVRAGLVP